MSNLSRSETYRLRNRLTARLDILRTLTEVLFDEPGYDMSILEEMYDIIQALKKLDTQAEAL